MKASKQNQKQTIQSSGSLRVRVVTEGAEIKTFDRRLDDRHYLGATRPVGDFLRQIVERDGKAVALLAWGAAALKLKDREAWIGWSLTQRMERLKLVVQNRRFLLVHDQGQEPNLPSQILAAACGVLPEQWEGPFGYRPVLAETFTDPEAYAGTCYKAAGWQPVGHTQGHSRHRLEFYIPNERPKRLWLKELCPGAREKLRAVDLDETLAKGCVAAPNGLLPLPAEQCRSLLEVLRQAPDPRANNSRFRIGSVLSLVTLALLSGARDVAQVARFATRLHPKQRAALGLPRKSGTRRFYEVPSYSVFYQVLGRMDPEDFAQRLNGWLGEQAGCLPTALSLDGKMIRDLIGTVTLADAENGSPVALAIMDQKEGTTRCEQTAARSLIDAVPMLEGQTVTADPLHCQRELARAIVDKGGDYLFQIKGNQPKIFAHAARQCQGAPPLCTKANPVTGASMSEDSS